MLNYIKAEIYRNFNRKYFWLYSGIIAAMLVAINLLLFFTNQESKLYNLREVMTMTTHVLNIPIFLIFVVLDFSFLEEYKNLTIKNVLSFGLSRTTYVLSKFIVAVFFSILLAVIVMLSFYGSTAILFGIGNKAGLLTVSTFLAIIATCVPLWIAAISLGVLLSVLISNPTIVAFVYSGIFIAVSQLTKLLIYFVSQKFVHLYNIMITPQLGSFAVKFDASNIEKAVISGIIYTIIFILLSVVIFNRKEIK